MDPLQSLIHRLASAAEGGEDKSLMLQLVNEIRAMLLQPASHTENFSESVTVVLPEGFRKTSSSTNIRSSSYPYSNSSALCAPRPPAVIVSEQTEEANEMEVVPPPTIIGVEESLVMTAGPETPDERPSMTTIRDESLEESVPDSFEVKSVPEQENDEKANVDEPLQFVLPVSQEMAAEARALEQRTHGAQHHEAAKPEMQQATKDLNEIIAQRTRVLNETFTRNEPELAEVLAAPHISDLKKAISINEKYQYINNLFRGDDTMFERSLKTLENFEMMAEARFWMQRELFVKLGWNEEDELVQKFVALVRRRFS
jgi:hypothetical protein